MEWREADRGAMGSNSVNNGVDGLKWEAETIFETAVIHVAPRVDIIVHEAIKQIPIRTMDLDTVKARDVNSEFRMRELPHDITNIPLRHRMRLTILLLPTNPLPTKKRHMTPR
jgi:hypothetical protein